MRLDLRKREKEKEKLEPRRAFVGSVSANARCDEEESRRCGRVVCRRSMLSPQKVALRPRDSDGAVGNTLKPKDANENFNWHLAPCHGSGHSPKHLSPSMASNIPTRAGSASSRYVLF